MKKIELMLFIVMLLSIPFIIGATEEIPPDFQPVASTLQGLLDRVNVFVGGFFGLYIIFILFRIHHERRKIKLLNNILYNLDQLNKFHHLPIAKEKKGFWWKLFHKKRSENGNSSLGPVQAPSPARKPKN